MNPVINILDCSNRLPGPFATTLLAQLGHNVVKWESRPDPFEKHFDPVLRTWYQGLNQDKKILAEDKLSQEIINNSDVIIEPPKELSIPTDQKKLIIRLKADQQHEKLHDLNAMAETGLLKISLNSNESLPFFPVGGVLFSYHIALNILNSYYSLNQKTPVTKEIYLTTPLKQLKTVLFPKDLPNNQKKYLHNGLYPCYNVFKTKDGHWLICAALEKKFFKTLLSILNLDTSLDQRFNQQFVQTLTDKIKTKTYQELKKLINDQQICVTLLTKD